MRAIVTVLAIMTAMAGARAAYADDRYLLMGSPTGHPFVAFVNVDRLEYGNSRVGAWLLEIYKAPNPALTPPAVYSLVRFGFDCQHNTDLISDIIAYSERGDAHAIATNDQASAIQPDTVVSRVADIACRRVPIDDTTPRGVSPHRAAHGAKPLCQPGF